MSKSIDTSSMEVKTMGGTEQKSVYVVFAEKNGLALGFRGDVVPQLGAKVIMLFARIRCQKQEDWANLSDGPNLFNLPQLAEKGPKHSSFEAGMIVAKLPVTPYQVSQIVKQQDLIGKMVDAILGMLPKTIKPIVTREQLVMYLANKLEDQLPDTEEVPLTEFPVHVGYKAIFEALKAVKGAKKTIEAQEPDIPEDGEGEEA